MKLKELIKYGWWVLIIAPLVFAVGVYVNNGYKINKPICPDDFATPEEKTKVMEEWTNNFFDTHPDASILDFSKARKDFYIENNCIEALKRYNDYIAGNVEKETQLLIEDIITEEILKSTRNYEEEFLCDEQANVWQTECLIEKLDRASAIREWKQRKLEAIKHPEILPDYIHDITKWREGFESARDDWCIAENSFYLGMSGYPGDIASCKISYEISALKVLDKIYNENIINVYGEIITGFEPTEKDIKNMMENNKTKRGCVWADDPACEYP